MLLCFDLKVLVVPISLMILLLEAQPSVSDEWEPVHPERVYIAHTYSRTKS